MAKIVPYEADNKQAVLQEYDILKSLHHDRIMALHEAYVTPRYLVLISEYCSGKELLYSLIDRLNDRIPPEKIISKASVHLPKKFLMTFFNISVFSQVPLLRG